MEEWIHCFSAAVKLPWRFPPFPPGGPWSRWTGSELAACHPGAPSAGGAGVMLIMGMDVMGASCTELSSADTMVYKLLQLGHNLPRGWSVLCLSCSHHQLPHTWNIFLYVAFSASAPLHWWIQPFVHFIICQPQWWPRSKCLKNQVMPLQ